MDSLQTIELVNGRGDSVRLLNLGARLCGLTLQLPSGPRNVVLGYSRASDYRDETNYLGCTIGRYCNRISRATFSIDDRVYRLSVNDGIHHLHGGVEGFDRRVWRIAGSEDRQSLTFELDSPDGDQGYPGNLKVSVRYDWNDERELGVTFSGESDAATHVNLTNHSYFNLDQDSVDILRHSIRIYSDCVTAVDDDRIPIGRFTGLDNSSLDFRRVLRHGDGPFGRIVRRHPLRRGRLDRVVVGAAEAPAQARQHPLGGEASCVGSVHAH
jgi:aldose 1-epimerase